MEPHLAPGEVVLIDPHRSYGVGDIVVCGHPWRSIDVVKRITDISEDRLLTLSSPSGTDSAGFGRVPVRRVRGKVTVSLTRFRAVAGTG